MDAADLLKCVLGVVLLGACASPAQIRHPSVVGVVDPNEARVRHWETERDLGIERRVLTDRASLIELTPSRICFHLARWSVADIRRDALEAPWVSARAGEHGPRRVADTITPGPRFRDTAMGARWAEIGGLCAVEDDGHCWRWTKRPRRVRQSVPLEVEVAESTACMPNDGLITAASERLHLEIAAPQGETRFEWELRR